MPEGNPKKTPNPEVAKCDKKETFSCSESQYLFCHGELRSTMTCCGWPQLLVYYIEWHSQIAEVSLMAGNKKCPTHAGHSLSPLPGMARSSFCNCWRHAQLPVTHVPYYGNNHHHCQHLHTLFLMNCFVSCIMHLY